LGNIGTFDDSDNKGETPDISPHILSVSLRLMTTFVIPPTRLDRRNEYTLTGSGQYYSISLQRYFTVVSDDLFRIDLNDKGKPVVKQGRKAVNLLVI
jgi:hypothetical protein